MHRILIISETFEGGGLETKILDQADTLKSMSVDVFLATGSLLSSKLKNRFTGVLEGLNLSPTASFTDLNETFDVVSKFTTEHGITFVETHPFTSQIFGPLIAEKLQLPFSCTLHGPLALTQQYGELYSLLLREGALDAAADIFAVSKETQTLLKANTHRPVHIQANSINIPTKRDVKPRLDAPILWAGRLDDHKIVGLLDLIEKLKGKGRALHVVGDGPARAVLEKNISDSDVDFVTLMGWQDDVRELMANYSIIAGMGRVLLEAAISQKPSLLVGYDGVKGMLDEAMMNRAKEWNYSGRNFASIDSEMLQSQLDAVSAHYQNHILFDWVAEHCNSAHFAKAYVERLNDKTFSSHYLLKNAGDYITTKQTTMDIALQSDKFLAFLTECVALNKRAVEEELKANIETTQANEVRLLEDKVLSVTADLERAKETEKLQLELAALSRETEEIKRSINEKNILEKALQNSDKLLLAEENEHNATRQALDAKSAENAHLHEQISALNAQINSLQIVLDSPAIKPIRSITRNFKKLFAKKPKAIAPKSQKLLIEAQQELSRLTNPGRPDLISVILPVYNQASFLDEAISSVVAQTYENWELIIVNDGSKDGFDEAIQPYLNHPKIRVFNQPNQKLPSALNNGFREARGEFFTWTSADNIMLPDQLKVLWQKLKTHPERGFAYSDYFAIDDDGNPLDDADWRAHNRPDGSHEIKLPTEATFRNLHDSGDNYIGASFLWRADVHAVVGAHDENTFGGEDYDFWLRIHLVSPFIHEETPLYEYRVHENTLNARAKELNLRENVDRLLFEDQQRRAHLLEDKDLPHWSKGPHWRDEAQYNNQARQSVAHIQYSDLINNVDETDDAQLRVVFLDVNLREIDASYLHDVDIVVCQNRLAYFWLKTQSLPTKQRLLFTEDTAHSNFLSMLNHAIALRLYEIEQEKKDYILATKPPAFDYPREKDGKALLLVGAWANGGVEQVVMDVATGFAKEGLEVVIAAAEHEVSVEMQAAADKAGIQAVGFENNVSNLIDYVTQNNISVVNFHHCYMGVDELKAHGIQTVYTTHNSYIWMPEQALAERAEQVKKMDRVTAVSRQVGDYAARWIGAPASHTFIIPNATSLTSDAANIKANHTGALDTFEDGTFTFLNAATFNRVKSQDKLLRAFAEALKTNPDIRLIMVGVAADEAFYNQILELRTKLDIEDACLIVPGTSRQEVLNLMQKSDCFVLPSIVEGWSIGLSEAALSGMPIITSDVGSARELASVSEAISVIPNLATDLENLHADGMWQLFEQGAEDFVATLQETMLTHVENREKYSAHARASIPAFEKFLAFPKMIDAYKNTLL